MTILAAGTDTQHFTPVRGGNVVSVTTAGQIGPNMQTGIDMGGPFDVDDIFLPDFALQTEIWITMYVYVGNIQTSTSLFKVYNSTESNELFRMECSNGSSRTMRWAIYNGSTYDTLTTAFVMPTDTLTRFDFRINISDTGNLEVYRNGFLEDSFSGDTFRQVLTNVDRVGFDSIGSTSGITCVYSHMLVSTTDSRSIVMDDLRATGAGNYSEMTGSFADIDELGDPDANFLISGSANQRMSFTKDAMATAYNTTAWSVIAMGVCASGFRVATGPQNVSLLMRSGATDGNSANQSLDLVNTAVFNAFANDPNTAAAWTFANADAAEFGVESEA